MTEKYGFVYIWRDRKHKRYYVGCHWGTVDDGYICSSNWMRDAYRRRPEDFKRRVIFRIYTSRQDMFLEEQRYLGMIKPEEVGNRYYNLKVIPINNWTTKSEDDQLLIKEKMSKSRVGKPKSEEVKNKIKETKRKNKFVYSEELKEKMRKPKSNTDKMKKPKSEEHKSKLSEARKGKTPWNKGISPSPETRLKISNSLVVYFEGKV